MPVAAPGTACTLAEYLARFTPGSPSAAAPGSYRLAWHWKRLYRYLGVPCADWPDGYNLGGLQPSAIASARATDQGQIALSAAQVRGLDHLTALIAGRLGTDERRLASYADLAYIETAVRIGKLSGELAADLDVALAWLGPQIWPAPQPYPAELLAGRRQILGRVAAELEPLCAWVRTGCPGPAPEVAPCPGSP